ncbi:class I SAM-dependent methyltransferase [Haloplanus rubicundus]|uniref:SAM-dependent methyltransferase n=1 Tax=Haloplanus rubicundus TaxID=1547898 RepID=A0A345EBX4_9EURY|nr:class I SAM-dependent methyltransferase [Haloplanus rubicundus]AXG09696.1 SAM-dependent methyltransferase [Haloplanus rubicundus]
MNRWQTAQQAERNHSAHTSIVSDQESAKSLFERLWQEDISVLSNKDMLAVGGGTGIIHALEHPRLQVSIDPLYEEKRIPRTKTNAEIICGSGEHLPFSNNSFDIVYSQNVLDHTRNPNEVLDEISRILKRDGQFFFSVNTFSLPKIIRNKLDVVDTPHPHHFGPEEIKQMLQSSGFKLENIHMRTHSFTEKSVFSLLCQKEFKKAGGKLAQIKDFCAICRLS